MNLFKWFSNHPDKVGFEDVKKAISNHSYTLINTMDTGFQDCLIQKHNTNTSRRKYHQ